MMDILHQDDALIVVDKPAGQVVIPGRGKDEGQSLVAEVEAYLGAKAWVVHRIDGATSGLVVFALTADAHRHLSLQFERRQVRKTYLAAVLGLVEGDGWCRKSIKEYGSGRMGVHPKGKPAVTAYRVLERFPAATLLEVKPETGRRHQIRVHLFDRGFPVLGDTVYGHDRPVGGAPRLLLHALAIGLEHPAGGAACYRAEPDGAWKALIEGLRVRYEDQPFS